MTTNIEQAAEVMARSACEELGQPRAVMVQLIPKLMIRAQALADAGLLMSDTDPLTEIQTESYHEIQVRRFPGDTHWHSHFQGTEAEVNDFLELNDQLLAVPSEFKRVVRVTTTKGITPIEQEQSNE